MSENKKNKFINGMMICFCIIAFLATVTMLVFFRTKVIVNNSDLNSETIEYVKDYAFISMGSDSEFWMPVYEEMKNYADEKGIYIRWMGQDITSNYNWRELMDIAIDAKVDGIILEGEESEECKEAINKAYVAGIPVVTVRNDCPASNRISYVGVSNYNLGIEYGQQIVGTAKPLLKERGRDAQVNVLVLVDKNTTNTSQNTILLAIQEQFERAEIGNGEIVIDTVAIDNETDFSAEESIQDVLKGSTVPDIIICLNEINTVSVYQAVVDQNKVGDAAIIGYSDAESIMKAIQKETISATITADVKQMGEACVEALTEYSEYGRANNYYAVNFTMINSENINQYISDGEQNENN